mgnify:CR=1 FL=1
MTLAQFITEVQHVNYRRLFYVRRFLFMGIAIIALGFVMILLAIVPQVFGDIDLRTRLLQETDTYTHLKAKMDSLLQTASLNNQKNAAEVNVALPSQKPLLALLSTVNATAGTAQVVITKIDTSPGKLATQSAQPAAAPLSTNGIAPPPAPIQDYGADTSPSAADLTPNQKKSVKTLDISVVANGTLSQINTYIDQLEQATPLINITKIDLTTLDPSGNVTSPGSQFEAKIGLTTYYFIQPIQVSIDDPLPEVGANEQKFLQSLHTFTFQDAQNQNGIVGGGLNDLFGVK